MNKAEWSKLTTAEKALWGRAFKSGFEAGQLEAKARDRFNDRVQQWLTVGTFAAGLIAGVITHWLWLAS